VIELGEVPALVRAAALGPGQRARRDQAGEGIFVAGELAQALGVAFQARVPPQGGPSLRAGFAGIASFA
jgi:hypothetical protein